jgi:hypothetical protein
MYLKPLRQKVRIFLTLFLALVIAGAFCVAALDNFYEGCDNLNLDSGLDSSSTIVFFSNTDYQTAAPAVIASRSGTKLSHIRSNDRTALSARLILSIGIINRATSLHIYSERFVPTELPTPIKRLC